jgi:hypothetical protein
VEDEALARLEQGGSLGKREDPRHHHLADPVLQRFGEETPGGNDAGEPALAVDDIEIEDALLEARGTDPLQGLTDILINQQRGRAGPQKFRDGAIEMLR